MVLAPLALRFSAGGIVVSGALGALLAGISLTLTASHDGRSALHNQFDSVFIVATALSALALAVASDGRAGAFLAAIVLIQAAVGSMTRYTAR
jgi:hypothetical protein